MNRDLIHNNKKINMLNNFKTGPNLVTAKKTGTFLNLGFTSTNTAVIFAIVNGVWKSWRPERQINQITGIEINKGYLVHAKIDFESVFFTPPLLVCPIVTYTKTSTTITAHISPVIGAASYKIRLTSSLGDATLFAYPTDQNNALDEEITGLTANTAYTITINPVTDTNEELTGCGSQVITTDPS